MSYILDALRKSDQLRQRGAAPTLLLGPAPAAAPKQPALFYYGLFALLLLAAGIAIGWLRPWQPQAPAAAPAAVAPKPVESAQDQASAAIPAAPGPQPEQVAPRAVPPAPAVPATAPAPVSAPAPAPAQGRAPAVVKSEKRSAPTPATAASPKQVAPASEQSARGSDVPAAAPAAPMMMMADLPLGIQQELPPMSISVHAYSIRTGDRLVGINGRLLHEGEYVAPGLKLEQITVDGMILNYKGYTFRRGVR